MESAEISVGAGAPDQLDPAYQLDFDPNAGLDMEGFDYAQFPQDEHIFTEDIADDATALKPDALLGAVDQGSHAASAAQHDQATNATQETGYDAELQVEYQEEIGYDDDDLVDTSINADLSIAEVAETEVGLVDVLPQNHPDPDLAQFADGSHMETLAHDKDASWDEDINFEEHSENVNSQDDAGIVAEEGLAEEDAVEHPENHDLAVADFDDETAHEQFAAEHHDNDLEDALDDLSHSLVDAPDLEVLYNEDCYSLFGTLDDDPESYFLSDVQELDRPLSQFLSALRAVISDEIAPTDEVVIRFDPLDLEFGERSNEKFLGRSFREILNCHTAVSRVRGFPADPVIHLAVRRDSEDHFLELLAEAELGKGSPHSAEDSEMSENLDQVSPAEDLGDGQTQDNASETGNSDQAPDESEHTATEHVEDKDESELETGPGEDDVAEEEQQELEVDASAPQPPSTGAEALEGERLSEDIPAATPQYEVAEDAADEEQVWEGQVAGDDVGEEQTWDEQTAEDDRTAPQDADVSLEVFDEGTHQPIEQHDGNELVDATASSTVDEAPAHENETHEQEAGSNEQPTRKSQSPATHEQADDWEIDYSDDEDQVVPNRVQEDQAPPAPGFRRQSATASALRTGSKLARNSSAETLCTVEPSDSSDVSMTFSFDIEANKHFPQDDDLIISFDDDHELPTIHEEGNEFDEYSLTHDASENIADEAAGLDTAGPTAEYITQGSENGVHVAAAAETASVHTSTTLNGDEIDYDEENGVDEPSTPDANTQQSGVASGADNDEIDWENDEDEHEQQPASRDGGAEYGESRDAAPTPPSVAGKRSRTDETESQADETDYKRRRT
ncbi:hypothetical protein NEMBOFW57_000789 [Staphylotrichum longicolle]|uniref:Uncharacterized protein n=1 Tax=Staphylotrichum longicolle TaxID=669026 RepID=A0AAD4F005_9PEZI|nr:hypothetical protein NEMBOFW57_000789 [Staphylotrichum longicolle]